MKLAQLALRVIAVLSFIVAIIWMIVAPGFEPLTVALSGFAFLITSFVIDRPKEDTETFDERNRRVMLNHVENFWVKGILEKSLHGAALLELGIKEDPNAISYPWGIKRESTDETLPAGKSMLDIFEEIGAGRSLLILGAPGSGKTTMLLELARGLIERARNDETEPIPVVFNLASWTEKQTLEDWLADQLNIIYSVPKKTAPRWVSENKMLLLLDGLDEVNQDYRSKCVDAINLFRKEHGLTSLVVCSRIEEYHAVNTKLSLEGAITLQSLTSDQVNEYFNRFGKSFEGVKKLFKRDKALRELAETPLMLSIMTMAYKDKKSEDLPTSKNIEEQRKHLFDTYINSMFERPNRATKSLFTKRQTMYYLSWLARRMVVHNMFTYQIEGTQPSWLENEKQRRLYKLISGLIGALIGGVFVGLISRLFFGLVSGLIGALIGALIGGMLVGLGSKLDVNLSTSLTNKIYMIDRMRWSWKKARSHMINWLIVGLIFGLIFDLVFELIGGLFFGLFLGLIIGLLTGLSDEQIEEITYPSQHLKNTFYNAISMGMFFWLIIMILFVLIGMQNSVLSDGLIVGIGLGLILGLISGLAYGLVPLLQHYVLRYILFMNDFLPRQLIPFLDHTVALIFMRRVGGSYIFVHRLLMEHFAEMDVEKS